MVRGPAVHWSPPPRVLPLRAGTVGVSIVVMIPGIVPPATGARPIGISVPIRNSKVRAAPVPTSVSPVTVSMVCVVINSAVERVWHATELRLELLPVPVLRS